MEPTVIVPLTDAQQRIVEDNIPLIYYVANPYQHVPKDVYQSIISRLHYRLCACAQRFNPERQNKISSYIVASLKGEIKNYFRDESWIIRPPRKLREMSFSTAVDSLGDEVSEAEKFGENPQTIGSCAIPVPLHSIATGTREDGDYELDIPSEDSVEKDVTDRYGGPLIVKEVFQSLRIEERIILALQIKKKSTKEIEIRFQLSRAEAAKAWKETKFKVQKIYHAALNGDPIPVSQGSEVIRRATRKRFVSDKRNYLQVREGMLE